MCCKEFPMAIAPAELTPFSKPELKFKKRSLILFIFFNELAIEMAPSSPIPFS